MAKKEDLFGKLNIKDYNNQLEEVLETKNFSSDTKNFLLSMLYKIETAYSDYSTVKRINKTKGEFIDEIIKTIQYNCEKIELVKPLDKKYDKIVAENGKCIVNKEKKEIISIKNEQSLLYAISKLTNSKYKFKNDVIKRPLEELMTNGKNINTKEVIRDFDGWAWNIETKFIENIECNLVFQNILMLIGDDLKTENEIKEKLNKIYQKGKAQSMYILLCKIAIFMFLNNHKSEKKKYKEKQLENQKSLDEMNNKVEYLKKITSERKKIEQRIKSIDKCLTDVNCLKKEYIKVNKNLEEGKKIFSISDFTDIIQNEKKQLICELQKYNKKMLPENYIKEKESLEENLKILEVIDEKNDIYKYLLELQILFIEGLQEKAKQVQTRSDMMTIIYKLRYYLQLPYKDKQIKDVKELREIIYSVETIVNDNACKMKVLNQISINPKVNDEVMRAILDVNIVELENIELLFKAENYQITLKIFDEGIIEKIINYDTIEGLSVRMNKRFRLFIK